ncbi:MAG: T9SS type A sorting domain-containing protein [Flavobacterium sp.]|nr:MAG: T9SS type A sorting domain-containing protein [Flavobacterium sp.]
MKKNFILLIALLFTAIGFSQEDAWVYFKNKPDTQYYFDNPLEMLSQRALDRRTMQNIPLDVKDVPIHQDYIDQISAVVEVMAKSKWLNAVHVRGSVDDINSTSALAFVDHIDFANHALNSGRPSAAHNVQKTMDIEINFPYGGSSNQIQMLNGHLLHQQNFTGSGKIIAVLDAGFPGVDTEAPFARLHNNNLILGGYNFVDRDNNFYTRNSHGTMVLSTMGGYVTNQLVGTAPDASYYLFITEDADQETPLEESLWVEAAETADSLGVDVINTSLGYFDYDNPNYSHTYEEMDGVTTFIARGADIAFSRGMVVVVSAGNSGSDDEAHMHIATPADAVNVLTVGAVDSFGNYAAFSSIGPSYDGRIKPDVAAKGLGATVANAQGNVVTASGTSFSGPIIAGMVATFWQAVPSFTNAQVVQYIKESASQFDNPDFELGYGIPDFAQAYQAALLSVPQNTASRFKVYPNPVTDNLIISLPSTIPSAKVSIYNALGQSVSEKEITIDTPSANLESLQNGVYFYKITSAAATQSGTLIKQ